MCRQLVGNGPDVWVPGVQLGVQPRLLDGRQYLLCHLEQEGVHHVSLLL